MAARTATGPEIAHIPQKRTKVAVVEEATTVTEAVDRTAVSIEVTKEDTDQST